jgi:hypothetical protein
MSTWNVCPICAEEIPACDVCGASPSKVDTCGYELCPACAKRSDLNEIMELVQIREDIHGLPQCQSRRGQRSCEHSATGSRH